MLNNIFGSVLVSDSAAAFSLSSFLLCLAVSLVLGIIVALFYTFRNTYTKGFVITLAVLPAMVQMVIMLVNGNLGAGVAVMGAFSLIRFRSVTGTARDISAIFFTMAIGLATGMGYLAVAALFTVILGAAIMTLQVSGFGSQKKTNKALRITIPEGLDYNGVFDDLFRRYLNSWELVQVKTTNMGSLYKLEYQVSLKDIEQEKAMIDDLRCRNGNLEILCGRIVAGKEEL